MKLEKVLLQWFLNAIYCVVDIFYSTINVCSSSTVMFGRWYLRINSEKS